MRASPAHPLLTAFIALSSQGLPYSGAYPYLGLASCLAGGVPAIRLALLQHRTLYQVGRVRCEYVWNVWDRMPVVLEQTGGGIKG